MADLRAATDWMMAKLADGEKQAVLAAATPYQHLFGLTAGGIYLVKGALGSANGVDRASPARFYAENLVGQSGALRDRVEQGAASLAAAGQALVA